MASKYRAIRTNGYASKAEANRAAELKILAMAGIITGYEEQRRFELLPACPEKGYKRALEYRSDFDYFDENGNQIVEDVKGFRTPVYRIKKRLMKQLLGIEIREL